MKIIVAITGFIILLGTSCSKPGCLGKAGVVQTQTRQLGSFSQVRLEGNINLVLVQGASNSAEITGPVNLTDQVSTRITEGKLVITNGSGRVTNTDTLTLDAFLLESYEGAGDVELTVDNRYTGVFVHLENASVVMHGKTEQCNTYTNSRGLTNLSDLTVKNMTIEYGGLADTYINVTGQLDAILYYKGNVYYKGTPLVTRDISYSTGQLIRRP
ncbi:MAG: hypothetical protein EOO05_08855 [Chitinophagaceae bacterium]|nr:MAG: hypothetical protein EOO05_08855 [Chitinophagaceae bacterium]